MNKKASSVKRTTIEGDSVRGLGKSDASKSKPATKNPTEKSAKARHQSTFVRSENQDSTKRGTKEDPRQEIRKKSQTTSKKSISQVNESVKPIPAASSPNDLKELVEKYLNELADKAKSSSEIGSMRKSLLQIIKKDEDFEERNQPICLDAKETQSLEKLLVHVEDQEDRIAQTEGSKQKYTALQEIDTLKTWIGDILNKLETGPAPVKSLTESATSSVRQSIQDISVSNSLTKVDTPTVIPDQKGARKDSIATEAERQRSSTTKTKINNSGLASELRTQDKEHNPADIDRPRSTTTANIKLNTSLKITEQRTPIKDHNPTGVEEGKARESKSSEKAQNKLSKRKKLTELELLMMKVTPEEFNKSYYESAVTDFIRKKQERIRQENEKKDLEEAKTLKFRPEIKIIKPKKETNPTDQPTHERLHRYHSHKHIKLEKLRAESERERELNESRELTLKPKINQQYFVSQEEGHRASVSYFAKDPLSILTHGDAKRSPKEALMTTIELQNFRPILNSMTEKLAVIISKVSHMTNLHRQFT